MMLNTGYAGGTHYIFKNQANQGVNLNHYTQNVAKMNELMNQIYNVYGGVGQNQQPVNVESILMQLSKLSS